jgi:hypothetical protein
MTKLTVAAAKDYVSGYYATGDAGAKLRQINYAGFAPRASVSVPTVRLIVLVTYDDGTNDAVSWDVFEEDDGAGGECLRGEY